MACIKNSQNYILRDNFCSYPSVAPCNLYLTDSILIIKHANKTDFEDIRISDIVGCQSVVKKGGKKEDLSAYLRIYFYPLKTNAGILYKQLRREKQTVTFVMRRFQTYQDNAGTVNQWRSAILWLIRGKKLITDGEVRIPSILPTAPKLLFIVNPHSGPGRASHIFKEQVSPILHQSAVQYEVLYTDKANCAREYMKTVDLKKWNGIVVVSGDGLLFEVYNGLMERDDWEVAVKTPLGIIPGGSGNGLARAISYATGEPYDSTVVTPSVLNVIHGRTSPMDLVCVQTMYSKVYSFLSIGWGLMADIDIESEQLRAIGEARFTVWAVYRALSLRTYKGRLSYLPVLGYDPENNGKIPSGPKMKRSKTIDSRPMRVSDAENQAHFNNSEPLFRSKSFGSEKSEVPGYDTEVELLHFTNSGDFGPSPFAEAPVSCENGPQHPKEYQKYTKEDCTTEHNSHTDLSDSDTSPRSSTLTLPPLDEPVPENWVVEEGEFVLVYVCHQTHLSTDVLFAPDAKLDDGIMWLIFIRSGVSRAKVIYFLNSLQTGDHVHIPYVTVVPVHAFRLEPDSTDDLLTVDGEVIPCSSIQAKVLPSIARIMTR